jgi:hypothetical protein
MSAFPTSPNNNDVYIKDGVRYVYASASNSWTIQADPNKTAGNIKSGVEIDNVTGTFPSDGDAIAGDVKSGKTFYSDDSTKKTGTLSLDGDATTDDVVSGKTFFSNSFTKQTGAYSPVLGDRTYVALNASVKLWYYQIGKYYIIGNFNEISGGQDTALPLSSDSTTRSKIAEKLGITIDSYGESNSDSSGSLVTAYNSTGDNWSLTGGKILNWIKST